MRYTLIIITLSFFIGPAFSQSMVNTQDIVSPELQERIKTLVDAQAVPSNTSNHALDSVLSHIKSDAWVSEQNALKERVNKLTGITSPAQGTADDLNSTHENDDRFVLFISSSIPLYTLRNYAADLSKTGGVMVMRGMIGGMKNITPTLEFIASVLKVDPSCNGPQCLMHNTNVVIDPELFREHAIHAVPSLVFVENMTLEPYCERFDQDSIPTRTDHVVVGDASIKHMGTELLRLSNNSALKLHIGLLE